MVIHIEIQYITKWNLVDIKVKVEKDKKSHLENQEQENLDQENQNQENQENRHFNSSNARLTLNNILIKIIKVFV